MALPLVSNTLSTPPSAHYCTRLALPGRSPQRMPLTQSDRTAWPHAFLSSCCFLLLPLLAGERAECTPPGSTSSSRASNTWLLYRFSTLLFSSSPYSSFLALLTAPFAPPLRFGVTASEGFLTLPPESPKRTSESRSRWVSTEGDAVSLPSSSIASISTLSLFLWAPNSALRRFFKAADSTMPLPFLLRRFLILSSSSSLPNPSKLSSTTSSFSDTYEW
mmetsp:Transcript_36029/g.87691  ORF Transcript_36029/g.87691 Transcript_36029/m.87691 type:complete len:219 (-) Transcript_36029:260-916(-)